MQKQKNTDINVDALFLGPKAENEDFFLKNLTKMFTEHSQWRKNFHPEDENVITIDKLTNKDFIETQKKTECVLEELSSKLRANMMPWHSMRYIGHMNAETIMPALLGYFAAMMYNGNNCAYEGAPATTILEGEVGEDFCNLMSIDPQIGWGHISVDGTTANIEALWYARNIKSLPFAIKEVAPELVEGKTEWELLNMSVKEILDILEKNNDKIDAIKEHSARAFGSIIPKLGKVLVPQTKHYSWLKAVDILGVGSDNLIQVPVDDHFRMKIDSLEEIINDCVSKEIPIMCVVGVVGSTEEGSVDCIDKIADLKDKFAKQGINFYFHIDAAFGAYCRTIFLDTDGSFIPENKLKDKLKEHNIFEHPENVDWPSKDIYNAFKDMNRADSLTIDPHKMGYVPYAAGGICIKDKRMRDSISYFANYTFEKGMDIPVLLGAFTLEGSKAGASAAAVWAAHQVLPLNISGYGKLIGASIESAFNIYNRLESQETFNVNGTNIIVKTLTKPEFNMVDFAFNIEGNKDLELMNKLNHLFYEEASFCTKLFTNDFITSHTVFDYSGYGDSPIKFAEKFGISKDEWDRVHSIGLLRATALNTFFANKETFDTYEKKIAKAIVEDLKIVLMKLNK